MNEQQTKNVVYLIGCATPNVTQFVELIPLLQAADWDVCVILTPQATRFADSVRLAELTGHPVRSDYKRPGDPDTLPRADALLVYPATFNTLNKWALGISDTLALGLLCELTGLKVPILAIPVVRKGGGLDLHPAFKRSLRILQRCGVHMLYEPDRYPPRNEVPSTRIVEAVREMMPREHA